MFVKLLFEAFEQNRNHERSEKRSLSITQTQQANKRLIVWTGILGEFDESSSLRLMKDWPCGRPLNGRLQWLFTFPLRTHAATCMTVCSGVSLAWLTLFLPHKQAIFAVLQVRSYKIFHIYFMLQMVDTFHIYRYHKLRHGSNNSLTYKTWYPIRLSLNLVSDNMVNNSY